MSRLLTKLELKVMNILWRIEKAFVKDIISNWSDPSKPAYNTISTTIRILEEKGFVGHEAFGRTHQYFPLLTKRDYQKNHIQNVLENVFSGSATSLISALVSEQSISKEELDEIQSLINQSEES